MLLRADPDADQIIRTPTKGMHASLGYQPHLEKVTNYRPKPLRQQAGRLADWVSKSQHLRSKEHSWPKKHERFPLRKNKKPIHRQLTHQRLVNKKADPKPPLLMHRVSLIDEYCT
ncbi:hypothetical protein FRC03_003813 [Tulasnella sp. 419]|nr:hypothetical protein FRC03_003813 [Tulasnella sp. 419]